MNRTKYSKSELDKIIKSKTLAELKKMGFHIWDKFNAKEKGYLKPGETHMLFPGTWYSKIPENYIVIDIGGQKEKFKTGISDNDIRFGALPYGFIRKF